MNLVTDEVRLTQFSHGAGCGCKIAPKVLDEILQNGTKMPDAKLLVGNDSKDDAAVYDLGNGMGLVSTTDFFMPIVDDPFQFGRIAAANAISDVYAMGGKPLMALAVLGWPVAKLSPAIAQQVIAGGISICKEAGIPLAGGHSIDSPEPIFGLSVSGLVAIDHLKRNNTAQEGDFLFLTKPIGVGIFTTALKRGKLQEIHYSPLIEQLSALNSLGEVLGKLEEVNAMTDVTGFGFLGHLLEMAEGSGLTAEIEYEKIPKLDGVEYYLKERTVPDSTSRNWNSYSEKVGFSKEVNMMEAFSLLPDPQTNGGLLISVREEGVTNVISLLRSKGLYHETIGRMKPQGEKIIQIK
ncbi:MAG TPA: selenide, water dikinase SelD [Chitinophagaceae bacterium]|nr:selenide, water dikinase SelD [Chitinophagaceae bacterium]